MTAKYKAGPAISNSKVSTKKIMMILLGTLVFVYAWGLFNLNNLGVEGLVANEIKITVAAILTSYVCEILFAVFTKKNIKEHLNSSFPAVSPLIFVLMAPANATVYAIVISTIVGVVFGKLVFGGFGQNVFNPAGVARTVLLSSFTTSLIVTNAPDLATMATPATIINQVGWLPTADTFQTLFADFGGLKGLLIGTHFGALGEVCTLAIAISCVILSVCKVIDWRISVTYLLTIFVGCFLIGSINGLGLNYALYCLLTGGVMFGGVFMLTDPVTSPVTRPGRVVFALFAGLVTLLIRFVGNTPEGVVYAILISNMVAPVIDKVFMGRQLVNYKKNLTIVLVTCAVVAVALFGLGSTRTAAEYLTFRKTPFNHGETIKISSVDTTGAEVAAVEGNTYTIKLQTPGIEYNGTSTYEVVLTEDGGIESVTVVDCADTRSIGDQVLIDTFLEQFENVTVDSTIDVISGATLSSKAVAAAALKAVKASNSTPLDAAEYADYNATVDKVNGNVYSVSADGYGIVTGATGHAYSRNTFEVTVEDGKVTDLKFTHFGDTEYVGDKCCSQSYLDTYLGKGLGDDADVITGSTYTSKSVASAVTAALMEGAN